MTVSSPSAADPPPAGQSSLSAEGVAELEARRVALGRAVEAMAGAVAADGGTLTLVDADVSAGVVTVELSGACSSCALSAATLEQGVERILRGRFGWVTEVRYSVAEAEWEVSAALGRGGWQPAQPDESSPPASPPAAGGTPPPGGNSGL